VTEKPTKERQRILKVSNWVWSVSRPDHPHRQIETQFGIECDLWVAVLRYKFHHNWLSSYRNVTGPNLAYSITLANGWCGSLYCLS